jgi:hypothetical protein
MRSIFKALAVGAVSWLSLCAPVAFAQSSASFVMDRVTVTSAAEPSASASFSMALTFAQEGPVGSISRCNDSFVQNTGFWSILGETPVPVILRVARDGSDPTLPALSWSGSSSEFTLYRAVMAQGVVDPLNSVLVTATCAAIDTPPPAAVVFYLVEPTGN